MNLTQPPRLTWAVTRVFAIMDHYDVSASEFHGRRRGSELVAARQAAVYILRKYRGPVGERLSFPEIAAQTGMVNHSTVRTQWKRINSDPAKVARAEEAWKAICQPNVAAPMPLAVVYAPVVTVNWDERDAAYRRLLMTGDTRTEAQRRAPRVRATKINTHTAA